MLSQGELSEGVFRMCFEKGLKPVVKPRKNSRKGRFRKQARRCFSREVYRLRGVAEGVFGAIEIKYRARIRARKRRTRAIAALLLALSYNISAAMRAVAMCFERAMQRRVCVFVLIRRQPP